MTGLIAEVSAILRSGMLFRRMLLLRALFRPALFLWMLALGMLLGTVLLLGMTVIGVRHGHRFRTAIGDMHSGIALRRSLMFIMLRHCRQRQNNGYRKKSENGFHHFNPPRFKSAKCSEVF
jgi:hypothetical protein